MAIYSMTAYARKETKGEWGTGTWEIRSVNQRYLETYLRLPEQFRGLEPVLRERFRKRLQRGKIECGLRFDDKSGKAGELVLNEALADQLVAQARKVSNQIGGAMHVNPMDILRWPGVMEAAEKDLDEIASELLKGFDQALDDFIQARKAEGEALYKLLEERLAGIEKQVAFVRSQMPDIIQWQRDKLSAKFDDANIELDEGRLEQEIVIQAQRLDVAEELDRLDTHVAEARKVLKKGGPVGRRLDFMMQEFNRESNTLASKSINSDITQAAVELKVLIEQMREQIQNLE